MTMRGLIAAAFAVALGGGLSFGDQAAAMSAQKWTFRPLVVVAPSDTSTAVSDQQRIVAAEASDSRARNERDEMRR